MAVDAILNVLKLKKLQLSAFAVGISIFLFWPLFIPRERIENTDAGNLLIATLYLLQFISIAYLIFSFSVFIWNQCSDCLDNKKKKKFILSHLSLPDLSLSEKGILIDKKEKKQKMFIGSSSNAAVSYLWKKGILERGKYIDSSFSNQKYEYIIPDFVWDSCELKDLVESKKA